VLQASQERVSGNRVTLGDESSILAIIAKMKIYVMFVRLDGKQVELTMASSRLRCIQETLSSSDSDRSIVR
jgi:hypothetical protein